MSEQDPELEPLVHKSQSARAHGHPGTAAAEAPPHPGADRPLPLISMTGAGPPPKRASAWLPRGALSAASRAPLLAVDSTSAAFGPSSVNMLHLQGVAGAADMGNGG